MGLKSKSAIQEHLNELIDGEIITKGRRGVIDVTPFGRIMLDRYDERGSV